jgi:hypothetical protein
MGGGGKDGDSEGRHRWMMWQSHGSITTINICLNLEIRARTIPRVYIPQISLLKFPWASVPLSLISNKFIYFAYISVRSGTGLNRSPTVLQSSRDQQTED